MNRFVRWGGSCDELHAALIIGSQARATHAADEYSDMDIVMIVDDPEPFIFSDQWLHELGRFHVSFVEATIDGIQERRVLFDDALDVDFILRPKDTLDSILDDKASVLLTHGYTMLLDKMGLHDRLAPLSQVREKRSLPKEQDFLNLINDFWYHSVWTAKKLKRGELWTAKFCLDSYMKWKLLSMIEYYSLALHGIAYNTWYSGRFIEEWAEDWMIEKLSSCFAHYHSDDILSSLFSTMTLFRSIAVEVAKKLGFAYPQAADDYASAWTEATLL